MLEHREKDGLVLETKRISFKDQLQFGQEFEDKFAQWLIKKGWHVIPKYLYVKEGAPLLIGDIESYCVPDIDASKKGNRIWVECKRKKRMFKHPATGYPLSNHKSYKKVQKITGSNVFIVFWDETDGDNQYYGNWLNTMDLHIYRNNWFFQNKLHITFKYPQAFTFIDFNNKNG